MAAWGHGVGVGADMAHGEAGAEFSTTDDHIIQRSDRAGLSCFWGSRGRNFHMAFAVRYRVVTGE